jgi:hypothetical protein
MLLISPDKGDFSFASVHFCLNIRTSAYSHICTSLQFRAGKAQIFHSCFYFGAAHE